MGKVRIEEKERSGAGESRRGENEASKPGTSRPELKVPFVQKHAVGGKVDS